MNRNSDLLNRPLRHQNLVPSRNALLGVPVAGVRYQNDYHLPRRTTRREPRPAFGPPRRVSPSVAAWRCLLWVSARADLTLLSIFGPGRSPAPGT
jgi:hypothetical protein